MIHNNYDILPFKCTELSMGCLCLMGQVCLSVSDVVVKVYSCIPIIIDWSIFPMIGIHDGHYLTRLAHG